MPNEVIAYLTLAAAAITKQLEDEDKNYWNESVTDAERAARDPKLETLYGMLRAIADMTVTHKELMEKGLRWSPTN
jgi:hypothetical protein